MNDSESSTESLRKKISHSRDNFMFYLPAAINKMKMRRNSTSPCRIYPVEVPEDDRKTIRTILLTSGKIVSLSVLLLKAKIKKRSAETAAAAGKRLLSYLSDRGLGEKQQYYVRRNKSNISF